MQYTYSLCVVPTDNAFILFSRDWSWHWTADVTLSESSPASQSGDSSMQIQKAEPSESAAGKRPFNPLLPNLLTKMPTKLLTNPPWNKRANKNTLSWSFFLLWLSKRISRSFWLHFEIVSNAHLPVDYLHTLFFVIFTERSKIPKWQNIEFCSPKYYQGKNITKEIKCYALEGQAIDKLTCFLLSPTIQ